MADINLNAATYEQIATVLSRLATNYSNLAGTFYDVFYNDNPENVTFQMFDDKGVLKDFTVKNLALSNEYRKTGNTAPTQNLNKGTLYQDLSSGDVYTKTTDTSDGWKKLVNSAFLDTFIMHGNGNPDGITLADLGTLYVDTVNVALYICVGEKSWAPISASFLEFANRNLDNITENGKDVIRSVINQELGTKTETIDGSSTSGQIPSALAVYQAISEAANRKQDKDDRTTVLSSISTDTQYPSAKCVYDALTEKQDKSNMVSILDSSTTTYPSCSAVRSAILNNTREVVGYEGITSNKQNVSELVSITSNNPDLTFENTYNGIENPQSTIGTSIVVADPNGPVDTSTTFIGDTMKCSGPYIIINGKLYKDEGSYVVQVGEDTGWTNVDGKGTIDAYAYGIRNNVLYGILGTTVTLLDDSGSWTVISGYSNQSISAYGIKDSKLYALNHVYDINSGQHSDTIEQVSSTFATGWTHVYRVLDRDRNEGAYGINSNQLYAIDGSSAYLIIQSNDCDTLSYTGVLQPTWNPLTINDSALWLVDRVGGAEVNDTMTWTKVAGYTTSSTSNNIFACAIAEGDLYRVNARTIEQIGQSGRWTHISATSSSSGCFGIRDGSLYYINASSTHGGYVTQWSGLQGWTDLHINTSAEPSDILGYGICEGQIYKINTSGVSLLPLWEVNGETLDLPFLGVTGNLQNSDTITLTYDTVPAYVVSREDSSYVVESFIDGTSWYRVYSDGWCEQGGRTTTGPVITVNLVKPYRNTDYSVELGMVTTAGSSSGPTSNASVVRGTLSTTSFTIGQYSTDTNTSWITKGYIG